MMSAETAMRQAQETAYWYMKDAASVVEELYPKASDESKVVAASNLAIATSLDYLAATLGGHIKGDDENFSRKFTQR